MRLPSFAPALVDCVRRDDGATLLRSPMALAPYARCVGDWLERWALETPDRVFLGERTPERRAVTYAEARASVRAIAQGLLDLGARAERPVLVLSDNSIDVALVKLAAMHVGVPVAPVSTAYFQPSSDFVKLRRVAEIVGPAVVYAADAPSVARALDALALGAPLVTSAPPPAGARGPALALGDLAASHAGAAVDAAFAAVGPDTVAKILFTSGSTGAPKGVVNTQRMLCSNQQAIAQLWPFLDERPPVIVDWLPWSHTFGANHNFNMILRAGGTLHVDAGRPAPGRIEATVAHLRDVSPTMYFNVPRGFDVLLPFLERDRGVAERLFADLDLLFYAAAALPQSLWERLERLTADIRPGGVPFVSAWGSTETAPLVTSVHFHIERAGVIGLPAPGCELLLVPANEKLEMRVRGPNVTPGAWTCGGVVEPLLLDDAGFLVTGDAGRLADPRDPSRGVVFDGRTAENFKLTTGTWVSVGELRTRIITACSPFVQDVVVAGHDRDEVTAILLLPVGARAPDARARILAGLRAHNTTYPTSSTRVARAIVLDEPLSIDRGETTDKGYVNQRAVLASRAALVDRLYASAAELGEDVLVP